MKLIKMKLFSVEYNWEGFSTYYKEIIEADNFAEAEKLFKENSDSKCHIHSITEYGVPVFRKSTKTITVEL